MAVIQPSLTVAIHCRHPHVRRQALSVLHLLRRHERWDTTLDIGRAEVVIKLEEEAAGYVYEAGTVGEGSVLDLGSLIPEQVRCWDCVGRWVESEDGSGNNELVVEVKRPVPVTGEVGGGSHGGGDGGETGTAGKDLHRVEGMGERSPRIGGGGHEGVSIVDGLFPRATGMEAGMSYERTPWDDRRR